MNYDIKCSKCLPLAEHAPAVACGSLTQRCQWLSSVTQSKLTKAHFKARKLVLASVAAFVKTPAAAPKPRIIQWIEVG